MTNQKATSSEAKVNVKFLKMLTKICGSCTPQSIKVYLRNIRRLHQLISDDQIPTTGKWLSDKKLMTAFKKLDLPKRRAISVAAVKATKAYGTSAESWNTQMYKAQSEYTDKRNKNEKSEVEKDKWPKGGFQAIKKAAVEQKRRLRHILKGKPTLAGLYKYQFFIVLKLFTQLPFRNTFATLQIEKTTQGNYLDIPKRGGIKIKLREYKNVKQLGEKEFTLNRSNTTQLRKFLTYRGELVDHKYLLSTRAGKKMTRSAMGKGLHKVTRELLGKSIGSRIIRVLAATESKPEIDKASKLADTMLHTTTQSKQYTRNK